jgi:hypothetical protein
MRKKRKSLTQLGLERFFQINQNPKKSKFQQRLDEVVEKHRKETSGEPTEPKVSLHDKENPVPWISVLDELPPYYTPVDILTDSNVCEDWNRVSDGDRDYYVNGRDNNMITNATHWRKRKGVKYRPYEPMTTHDVPVLSTNDVKDMVKVLNEMITWRTIKGNPYLEYHTSAIKDCIAVIETTLALKTRSVLLRADSSILPPGK